jgi:hypothetical protein
MTEQTNPDELLNADQQWRRDHEMLKKRLAHQAREAAEQAQRQNPGNRIT